jgi:hypothetical protein
VRRLFWIAVGAGAGIYVARQLRQTAQNFTPDTVVGKVLDRGRDFWADVRDFSADREIELREAFGLADDLER